MFNPRKCQQCGITFDDKYRHKQTYCGRSCFAEVQRIRAAPEKEERRIAKVRQRSLKKLRSCKVCGKRFLANYPKNKCSTECWNKWFAEYNRERYVPKTCFPMNCLECGEVFSTNGSKKYCSNDCAERGPRRRANDKRRANMRNAFVAPVYRKKIYTRDGWICQLCLESVDPTLKFPEYLSPTLDHVIPLAKGGTHEPANVQLAHFICNSRKSDRMDYEAA